MKSYSSSRNRGFTLIETVIAIGVLAVLLTGFMAVFAPAAAGIRKSLNVQEADRLASTLEQELVTLRAGTASGSIKTGFAKAFEWIRKSNTAGDAIMVYQYRGSMSKLRKDGTPQPEANIKSKLPGKDYVLHTMVRRKSDSEFLDDLTAVEGGVYVVKCTQLIFSGGQLKPGSPGTITDPKGASGKGGNAATADAYPEAVIAFSADFYALPSRNASYFGSSGGFTKSFTTLKKPVFTRNLAVRR
jgi:prepilin-type N-terminal cleavage/methylation domain-containing protein